MNKKVALLSPNFEWKLFTLWYENSTLFGLAPLIYALRGGPISSLAIARFLEASLRYAHPGRRCKASFSLHHERRSEATRLRAISLEKF